MDTSSVNNSRREHSPILGSVMRSRMKLYDTLMSNNLNLNLRLPDHVLDPSLFLISRRGATQKSWTTIFSIWNSMIGSTILAMPWAMEQSGLMTGALLIMIVGALSCYTCKLILQHCLERDIEDVTVLVGLLFGRKGEYVTVVMSVLILTGACMVFNVLLSTSFYNILNALFIWIAGNKITSCERSWEHFSDNYTSYLLFLPLIFMCTFRERITYIRINSGGVFFILIITISLIGVGIRALLINSFTIHGSGHIPEDEKRCTGDWNCLKNDREVKVSLYESNFMALAGIFSLSFFIHNFVVIIMKNNQYKEKNTRDLTIGYIIVGLSYLIIGQIGYFGFKGNGFPQETISQNALDMFAPDNVFAFIIRCIVFIQMFTIYPMIVYIVRCQLLGFIYQQVYPSKKIVVVYSICICSATTFVASIYPEIGSIAGYTGAFIGLYFIFIIPVVAHIKFSKPKIKTSEMDGKELMVAESDEKINIQFRKLNTDRSVGKWRVVSAAHCLIILFGLCSIFFQFYKIN